MNAYAFNKDCFQLAIQICLHSLPRGENRKVNNWYGISLIGAEAGQFCISFETIFKHNSNAETFDEEKIFKAE